MALQALTGFRDFFPQECALRDHIFRTWREAALSFAFRAYDGPPLESLELYIKKNASGDDKVSGEEILTQVYQFKDRGERDVALRPEMTPTLARMAGLKHREFRKPMKWFSIPQLFRYERPQKGRLREHYQWNADILGEAGPGAEAELICLLATALKKFGFTAEDFVIRLSDRQFWADFLKERNVAGAEEEKVYAALDKIERNSEEETRKLLGPLFDPIQEVFKTGATSPRLTALHERLVALGLGDYVTIDLKIVRGLAYYTGYVFEVHDRKGVYRAIAGGGRYDHLVEKLTGQKLPAVGFGMGDVVLAEMLRDRNLLPDLKGQSDFFLIVAEEAARPQALHLVMQLRESGYSVDYPLEAAKFGKQLELANDRNARYALIFGKEPGAIELKEMTTGEQKRIAYTQTDSGLTFSEALPAPSPK